MCFLIFLIIINSNKSLDWLCLPKDSSISMRSLQKKSWVNEKKAQNRKAWAERSWRRDIQGRRIIFLSISSMKRSLARLQVLRRLYVVGESRMADSSWSCRYRTVFCIIVCFKPSRHRKVDRRDGQEDTDIFAPCFGECNIWSLCLRKRKFVCTYYIHIYTEFKRWRSNLCHRAWIALVPRLFAPQALIPPLPSLSPLVSIFLPSVWGREAKQSNGSAFYEHFVSSSLCQSRGAAQLIMSIMYI